MADVQSYLERAREVTTLAALAVLTREASAHFRTLVPVDLRRLDRALKDAYARLTDTDA